MVAAITHPGFEKDARKLPPEIQAWAADFVDFIESRPAAQIKARASKLRGKQPDVWAAKKRFRPHGEYRLIFQFLAAEEAVLLVGCAPRQSAYQKILRRRGRGIIKSE